MAPQEKLIKYRVAAEDFTSGKITFETFLNIGLEPFLSGEAVADSSDEQLELLGQHSPGGRVMAAMILLATEPGLGSTAKEHRSMLAEEFHPMLLACCDQLWHAVVRLDPDNMLSQAYLRQAMVLVALLHGNENVASNLIALGSPPPRSLLAMLARAAARDECKFNDKVLLGLIAHGWLSPNLLSFLERAFLTKESAIKLIDMLCDAQETSPIIMNFLAENQDKLLDTVASRGSPRTLNHLLRRLGRWESPPEFLVPASTREGSKGSVAMLRYLIEERSMDVNWIKQVVNPADSQNSYLDIRERGYPQSLPDSTTALHGAANHGNIDAVKYLLKRGAETQRSDGKHNYPEMTAMSAKQDRAAAIIRSYRMHGNRGKWESL